MTDPDRIPRIAELMRQILEVLGVDPTQEGMVETPDRMARSWVNELCKGVQYSEDELVELVKTFHDPSAIGQMISIRDVDFVSLCEHHMIPFYGKANVVYIPNGKGVINGLSKVPRVLDILAARPQVQERLTAQLFSVLQKAVEPTALLVSLEATHQCMTCRGVKKTGATTATMKYGGLFESDPSLRRDALHLLP